MPLSSCMAELDRQQTRVQLGTGTQTLIEEIPTSSNSRHEPQTRVGTKTSAEKVPKPAHQGVRGEDPELRGFLSSAATCHIERRQLGLRLRARSVAVELALAGERRFTLPEIAERVGTSTRTLNVQFGVKDALFAFPPPELVPALFECWFSAGNANGLKRNLKKTFQQLDGNPLARSLLTGLARLHAELPKLSPADGYFNAALRIQLVQQESRSTSCLSWTGYITDALRDSFQEWALHTPKAPMVSMVPNLMDRLRPIAFR